jgi:outer membrane biogenesis lipoprotein LolB
MNWKRKFAAFKSDRGGIPWHKRCFWTCLFTFFQAALLANCAHIIPPPADQPQARQIVAQLTAGNRGLSRFKGLARIEMGSASQTTFGRIAVAAVAPDKLRVEWLNMMGLPDVSIAGDGQTITILNRADKKVRHLRQTSTALEKLVHIPIGIEDLQRIMSGAVPLPGGTAAQIEASPDNKVTTLVLKDRWHATVAVVKVDPSDQRIQALKRYDRQGALLYEVRWLQWRRQGQYLLPVQIAFESASGGHMILTMDRFWPEAQVPLALFALDPP